MIFQSVRSAGGQSRPAAQAVLLPLCLLGSWCVAESAAPPAEEAVSLETVIVETSVLLESGARVELDRADVVRTSAVSLGDVLTQVPNVKVQTNSRGEQVFALRGSDQRQVAVTLDGASVVSAWDGQLDLSVLPSSAIGSIAITRGTASVLQGPNALIGAVNIVSRQVENAGWDRSLSANAGLEWQSVEGFVGHRQGNHSLSAALGWSESDGYVAGGESDLVTGSDFRNRAVMLGWGYRYADESSIGLTLLSVDNSKGVISERSSTDPRFWRYPELRKNQLILFGRHAAGISKVDYSLFVQDGTSRIDQFTDATYTELDNVEDGRDSGGGGRVQWSRPFGATQELVAGVDWSRSEHLFRERASSASFTTFSQDLSQFAAEWRNDSDRWDLLLGVSYDSSRTPDTGTLADPSPQDDWAGSGAVTCSLSPDLSLDFTLGRKTRFPSLRESFNGALGRFVLNPELRPETAVSAALGVVGQFPVGNWEVRAFATEIDDGITRVPLPNGQFTRVNLTSSRILGVEAGMNARPADWLEVRVDATVLKARAQSGSGNYDQYLEYRPGVNFGSEIILALPENWRATAGVRYLADEYGFLESSPDPQRLPSYILWNLSVETDDVATSVGTFAFVARVENLSDNYYQTQWGIPGAGRRASIGVIWSH